MKQLEWRLRKLMAERGMFQTTELGRLLADQGIIMSREQIYRLVTTEPQRLNMKVLLVLCEVLDCTPNDLIRLEAVQARRVVGADSSPAPRSALRPVRARVARPTE